MAKLKIKEARLNYNIKDKLIEKLNDGLYDVVVPYLATLSDEALRENEISLENKIELPTFQQGMTVTKVRLDGRNDKTFYRKTKNNNNINKNLYKALNHQKMINNGNSMVEKDKSSAFRPVEVSLPIMRLVELNENDFEIKVCKKESAFIIMEKVQETIEEIRSSIFLKDYDLKDRLEKFLKDVLKINVDALAKKVEKENTDNINDIFGTDLFMQNDRDTRKKYDLSKILF